MRAFLFPGQGSQKVGMGRALFDGTDEVRNLYGAADDALGFPLTALCLEGPEAELMLTANTQPAILLTTIAALRQLREEPDIVAGHSLGEYAALVCAGALEFVDALRLVHLRGRFMQEAVPAGVGAMAAIVGLDAEVVAELCAEAVASDGQERVCAVANFNGAGQVVIAGHGELVARAMQLAKNRGAKLVKALPVSAPFHCSLMAPAGKRLAAALEKIEVRKLKVPVVTNVEAKENRDHRRVRDLLVRQVTAPVRWEQSMRRLVEIGVTDAVEVGPGRVLAGLARRIAPTLRVWNVETPEEADKLREEWHVD